MEINLFEVLERAKKEKSENEKYLKSIRAMHGDAFFPVLKNAHDEVFSNVNCLNCANCCKTTPPLISNVDVIKMARFLGLSVKMFVNKYTIQDHNGELMFNGVPCRFLNQDNSCSIYEVRPEACRRYPHTDEKEYTKRTALNTTNTIICPAAYLILIKLKNAIPSL